MSTDSFTHYAVAVLLLTICWHMMEYAMKIRGKIKSIQKNHISAQNVRSAICLRYGKLFNVTIINVFLTFLGGSMYMYYALINI